MGLGGAILMATASSEHIAQVQVVSWFRKTYPSIRLFAIPMGGARSASTGAMLRAEGCVKGIPDIFIPELKLFIEMKKAEGGRVSPEQLDWLQYLNSVGYTAKVCHGFEDAKAFIQENIKKPL